MHKNELRIGNWINYKGEPIQVTMIGQYGVQSQNNERTINASFNTPDLTDIPVTPSFLDGLDLRQMLHIKDLIMIIENEKAGLWNLAVKQTGLVIWSVHHLQNFFYANTYMELIV